MSLLRNLRQIVFVTIWFTVLFIISCTLTMTLYVSALLKWLMPTQKLKNVMHHLILWCDVTWQRFPVFLLKYLNRVEFDVQGLSLAHTNGRYLVLCNHRSWSDSLPMFYLRIHGFPPFKVFCKWQVIFIPLVNFVAFALDFPLMSRYTPEQLRKNPKLRNKDLITTQKACAKIIQYPFTLLNFCEGTRFTPKKHLKSQSPYQHLLPPKAGGVAIAYQSLSKSLDKILSVTLIYPEGNQSFISFLAGNVKKVIIRIEEVHLPEALKTGDYLSDASYRQNFKHWLEQHWHQKDRLIHDLLTKNKYWSYNSGSPKVNTESPH